MYERRVTNQLFLHVESDSKSTYFSNLENPSYLSIKPKEKHISLNIPVKLYLRGDYTTRFGNFTLYYNFLTNSLKFIKVIRKNATSKWMF